ncbi:hypothetical protein [Rhodococcus wratislaviensis]|uniref:hypothetical protein n=1 Tax=Rhodococcus wratislaviensis TaxID=44752 RepID=UPI00351446EF
MTGETTDRMRFDSQIRRRSRAGDTHAGACPYMSGPVQPDSGGIRRGDDALTECLDVTLAVREDNSAVLGADPGMVGPHGLTFSAGIDGTGIEGLDVGVLVGGHSRLVRHLKKAATGDRDGAAADAAARLPDQLDRDSARDASEVEPEVRMGIDHD